MHYNLVAVAVAVANETLRDEMVLDWTAGGREVCLHRDWGMVAGRTELDGRRWWGDGGNTLSDRLRIVPHLYEKPVIY